MLQTSPVPALTKSSSLFCTLGLGVTLVLLQEQQKLVGTSSSTGAAYLDDRNTTYGFLPTAIVHSLPHASFVWALLLFAIQGFWMAFADLPSAALLPVVIPVSVSLVVASLGIWKALHPRLKSFEDTVLSEPIPPLISPLDQKEFLQADVMV
ncbi:hypothetical protein B0F90DRAFT_325266 [Multifurca ochricompacta]|uniref:Uncharacterized protein n=1 Tax=Multifurca ochricompacta TaxID=376703 RepID=A0AAD4M522_9AGAM|nr:hypothetical protein B0F90DRAFT_325266 [Multifurca ochricompacta]